MTEALVRDEMIGLLDRLGSERDEEVLEAARQAHARITAAGVTWEDLLAPEEMPEPDDEDVESDLDDPDEEDEAPEPPEVLAEVAKKNAESLVIINKLLAGKEISEDLRRELEGYKTDIDEGEFEERDRKYIRALQGRLSKRGGQAASSSNR